MNEEELFLNVERMLKETVKRPSFLIVGNINAYNSEFKLSNKEINDNLLKFVNKEYKENQEVINAYDEYKKSNKNDFIITKETEEIIDNIFNNDDFIFNTKEKTYSQKNEENEENESLDELFVNSVQIKKSKVGRPKSKTE